MVFRPILESSRFSLFVLWPSLVVSLMMPGSILGEVVL
jgi:hypothetical protein